MAQPGQNMAAERAAGARGGPGNRTPAVDSILEAIIRAVHRYDSFVLKYCWIEDELMAVSGGEYDELEEKMYELISDGKVKNVRIIYRHVDSIGDSVVVVSPCELTNEQWRVLEDLGDLYGYSSFEDPTAYRYSLVVKRDRPSLDIVIHNLVRMWCAMTHRDDNAEAVYEAFNAAYKLKKSFQRVTEDVEV